jgi:colicin import membrane protein
MSAALAGPFLEWRREDDLAPAMVLAVVVHVVLAAALVLGVSWQSRAPEVISVELWQPPPPPPPVAQPEPPRPGPAPQAKPEPRIEKPDIAIKEPPKPKPKPEAKPKPKPVAKPAPPKPDDRLAQQRLREELAREQQVLAAVRESQVLRDRMARDAARSAASARERGIATWVDRIRAKIRGNIVLPPELKGNPEALYLVTQLPTGEVLEAKLVISSGHAAYDDAVHRAILKSSPLPRPDSAGLFERELKLTFRPRD